MYVCVVCELKMNSLSLFFFSNNVKSTVASGRIQGGTAGNGTVGLEINFVTLAFFFSSFIV